MAIEVLQAELDIHEFVRFIYDNGYFLSHRDGDKKNVVLSQNDAISSLIFDLNMSGGTYNIGNNTCYNLVGFDSCGMQSHPSKEHSQGRFAGKLAIISPDKEQATSIFKNIRKYIRKSYVYKQYNNHANMCCYFAPHYLELEKALQQTESLQNTSRGFLHIRCNELSKPLFQAKISNTLDKHNWIHYNRNNLCWKPYWANKELFEMSIPFHYDVLCFEKEACIQIASNIIGTNKPMEVFSTKILMRTSWMPPASEVEQFVEFCQLIGIWELTWPNQGF